MKRQKHFYLLGLDWIKISKGKVQIRWDHEQNKVLQWPIKGQVAKTGLTHLEAKLLVNSADTSRAPTAMDV